MDARVIKDAIFAAKREVASKYKSNMNDLDDFMRSPIYDDFCYFLADSKTEIEKVLRDAILRADYAEVQRLTGSMVALETIGDFISVLTEMTEIKTYEEAV